MPLSLEKFLLKSSEFQRIERLKVIEENAKKTPEEQELEDYFKDSLQIDMSKSFQAMHLEKKLLKVSEQLNLIITSKSVLSQGQTEMSYA